MYCRRGCELGHRNDDEGAGLQENQRHDSPRLGERTRKGIPRYIYRFILIAISLMLVRYCVAARQKEHNPLKLKNILTMKTLEMRMTILSHHPRVRRALAAQLRIDMYSISSLLQGWLTDSHRHYS